MHGPAELRPAARRRTGLARRARRAPVSRAMLARSFGLASVVRRVAVRLGGRGIAGAGRRAGSCGSARRRPVPGRRCRRPRPPLSAPAAPRPSPGRRGRVVVVAARHQHARVPRRERPGRPEPGDLALVHDRDPVGQRVDLVQLCRDDQHGHALVALAPRSAGARTRSNPRPGPGSAGWPPAAVLPAELPGQDDLLLVAAGQRARRRVRSRWSGRRTRRPARLPSGDGVQVQRDAGRVGGRLYTSSTMLSATEKSPISPSSCRSSGT